MKTFYQFAMIATAIIFVAIMTIVTYQKIENQEQFLYNLIYLFGIIGLIAGGLHGYYEKDTYDFEEDFEESYEKESSDC